MRRLLCWLMLSGVSAWAAEPAGAKFGKLAAGSAAPDFSASRADGRPLRWSDVTDKVVVVNFWTTNRGPADVLESAFAQYRSLGVEVIGVCANATREEFDAWLKRHQGSVTY